ncbi:MAG: hypothetical protein KKA36_00210 [Gammaproteobacteria bacterium]|nr:hypothetical protein [Gammaproteobacteria bacterium]MBU2477485.1 hypothetical protein [Gammaproteobacteria bacterium]
MLKMLLMCYQQAACQAGIWLKHSKKSDSYGLFATDVVNAQQILRTLMVPIAGMHAP